MSQGNLLSAMPPVILEDAAPSVPGATPGAAAANAAPTQASSAAPGELSRAAPAGMISPSSMGGASDGPTEVMLVGGTPQVRAGIVEALKTIYDPEIPVNIYELGLIYNIVIDEQGAVLIRMTLTSPACPVAGSLPPEVEAKVKSVEGVADAKVEIVWEPTWSPAKMSEEAKLLLNLPY